MQTQVVPSAAEIAHLAWSFWEVVRGRGAAAAAAVGEARRVTGQRGEGACESALAMRSVKIGDARSGGL